MMIMNRRIHHHRSRLLIKVLLFCLTLSTACNVPVGDLATTYGCAKDAKRHNIVGTWAPDQETLKEIQERGKYSSAVSPKIIFREGGAFELNDMPNWVWDGDDKPNGGFKSLSGEWSISSPDGCAEIGLRHTDLSTASGTTTVGRLTLLQRRIHREPIFIIEILLGDPDSGDKMIFVRK
jgi:hypothetical protein